MINAPNNRLNKYLKKLKKIILGKIERLNEKFRNLESFYSKTMIDSTINNYTSINLKYNKQVVCTKEVEYGTQ